jgi:hypothetical protein
VPRPLLAWCTSSALLLLLLLLLLLPLDSALASLLLLLHKLQASQLCQKPGAPLLLPLPWCWRCLLRAGQGLCKQRTLHD